MARRIGAHVSIRGGLEKAFLRGKTSGCRVIQIFTKSTVQWAQKNLTTREINAFNRAREETCIDPVSVHDSYLINLASPRARVRERSFQALLSEVERAGQLEIPFVVMHPGSHGGNGLDTGIQRISDALNRIHDQTKKANVTILLETTAGQGSDTGYRFEHLARIIGKTQAKERMGVCFDTCHVFAAGYDFRDMKAYKKLMNLFDNVIGLKYLKLFHLNDSKRDLGARVDRHEHLGHGYIGKTAFSQFLNDPLFQDIPFIIETPKGKDENHIDWDVKNLRFLRELLEE
jgi:deoxyribonuclease-4